MSAVSKVKVPLTTIPRFQKEAAEIALQMSQFSVDELERLLRVNAKIAVENYKRYQAFHAETTPELPALLAYTGIVFKRLNPKDFSAEDFGYAQEHLRLTSFCYGLLRPLDVIRAYRLEGDVVLPELGNQTLFSYWRSRLTDTFIEDIRSAGGILCNLASDEMKSLFDWKRVESEVRVVTPEFHVWKNGKLATIVVYTKMSRGEMTRFILKNKIGNPEELKGFSWEGFEFDESLSDERKLVFINGMGDSIGYSRMSYVKRDSRIAIIPIGYADGLDRHFSNGGGEVVINGHRCPIIGNICMDACMIDVTDTDAHEGDSVIIFGEELPVSELSDKLKTIPYEILTSISPRVKRVYYRE